MRWIGRGIESFRFHLFTLTALVLGSLVVVGMARPTMAAYEPGMAAFWQAATDERSAALNLYSPAGQQLHAMALPDDLPDDAVITRAMLSPDGRHWFYLTGAVSGPDDLGNGGAGNGEELQADLRLHVRRTSDGEEVVAIPLLPSNFPENITVNADLLLEHDPTLNEYGDLEEALWQAFRGSLGTAAWSPDGSRLAFSSAQDGPSSDLYLYHTYTGEITRLTDGIEQIDGLKWSPDGRWIWHSTISYGYCQVCDGHHYAAAADGSEVVNLPGDDIYQFLAWDGDDAYLVTDQSNGPGSFGLRRVEIATGREQMLWPGTHQGFVYDAKNGRLGIIGTRGQIYDPNEQVFVIDLATGDKTEYEDLASALKEAPWLAPLGERPINYRCQRAGVVVYPCLETPYDPLSPDGELVVTDDFAVELVENGEELLAPLVDLEVGQILWRRDGMGFFITQPTGVIYRDATMGDTTEFHDVELLGWLPYATPAALFSAPRATAEVIPSPQESRIPPGPTPQPTVMPTPEIVDPYRYTTLDGSFPETASRLRVAQAIELARMSQIVSDDQRASGLQLLLAREAALTYLNLGSAFESTPNPEVETEMIAALDSALGSAPATEGMVAMMAAENLPLLRSLAASPDGDVIATGHADGSIRLWSYESGALMRFLTGSGHAIIQLYFSSDGTMLAATDETGLMKMWNALTGEQSSIFVGQYTRTYATAWRPYSYAVAIANGEAAVTMRPRSGSAFPLLDRSAVALAYRPDGTQLALALPPAPDANPAEQTIWIVDADTGEQIEELQGIGVPLFMLYSPDGKGLVVGGEDFLQAWNVASATLIFETDLENAPTGWALTPEGDQIAILNGNSEIGFYDLSTGAVVRTLTNLSEGIVGLAFNPTTGVIISGDVAGYPILLGRKTGEVDERSKNALAKLVTTSPAALRTIAGHVGSVADVAIHPLDGWAMTAGDDHWVRGWNWQTGEQRHQVIEENEGIRSVDITVDGFLTGDDAGDLRLYGPGGELQTTLHAHSAPIVDAIISPDGLSIASASEDGTLRVWNRGRQVQVWSVADLPDVGAIAYAPDNTLLAGAAGRGSGNTIYIWDAYSGDEVSRLHGHRNNISSLAFSPDGTLLASASWDQSIKLWEVATGEEVGTLAGHGGKLTDIAFSPNGEWLASVAEDYTLRLWDVAAQREVILLEMPRALPSEVVFSVDGKALLTAHADGMLRTWLVDPDDASVEAKLLRAAATIPRITAEFTSSERQQFAIDSFVGFYALSASSDINLRPEPYFASLVVQPPANNGTSETLIGLTDERFLLTSTDQGESWAIVTRLPLTLTYHSLGIPARASDPLLLTTDGGVFEVGDEGALTLVHSDAFVAVSYSHTNPDELWAVQGNQVYKSEDRGASWGEAADDLEADTLYAPLLMAPPNNNPQIVAGVLEGFPLQLYWRGAGNGFWQPALLLTLAPDGVQDQQGLAWDAGNRTLYFVGPDGSLLASETMDATDLADVAGEVVANFGPGSRVIPLAVGQGPHLYVTLHTSSNPRILRASWDGEGWSWVALRLPIIGAG